MNMKYILILLAGLMITSGCVQRQLDVQAPPPAPVVKKPELDYVDLKTHSYRARKPIPNAHNQYEGSLWKDESSWGNLLRDHRARFKGDVVTITGLQSIISISDDKPATPAPAATAGAPGTPPIAKTPLSGKEKVEQEQKDVLRKLTTISGRVAKVLPNGNMLIVGEKIDYKQLNTIRYVTKISGIIRPEDVNRENQIAAVKMAKSEVQIKRQMLARSVRLNTPQRLKKSTGLLDRLSHIATPSKKKAAPAPTK